MRRVAIILALTLVLPCGLAGCKKSPPPARAASTDADVVGTWIIPESAIEDLAYNAALMEAESAQTPPSAETLQTMARTIEKSMRDHADTNIYTYEFKQGGAFRASVGKAAADGTWSLDGNTLIVSAQGGESRFEVKGGGLTLSPRDNRGRAIVLVRK